MSSLSKLRILLDSTYLLPMLGVEVEDIENALTIAKKLHDTGKVVYYYTPFNLLEILGKLEKTHYHKERIAAGLIAIKEQFKITHPTPLGYLKALGLRSKGHKDLIDLLLYATALTRGIIFLTRDDELIDFLKEQGENISIIIHEKEFIRKYGEI